MLDREAVLAEAMLIGKVIKPLVRAIKTYDQLSNDETLLAIQQRLIDKWDDRIWVVWFGYPKDHPQNLVADKTVGGNPNEWEQARTIGIHIMYYKMIDGQFKPMWYFWNVFHEKEKPKE